MFLPASHASPPVGGRIHPLRTLSKAVQIAQLWVDNYYNVIV